MKYIIEIEDKPNIDTFDKSKYYKCKQVPYWYVSENIKNKLTPYTEPDRKAIEDEVWAFAWKLFNMDFGEYAELFDDNECPSDYRDTKAKYEAWKKQKDEIRVGDEVIPLDTRYDTMVVTKLWASKGGGGRVDAMASDGKTYNFLKSDINKTGRHFPEVAELLKKMRDADEN